MTEDEITSCHDSLGGANAVRYDPSTPARLKRETERPLRSRASGIIERIEEEIEDLGKGQPWIRSQLILDPLSEREHDLALNREGVKIERTMAPESSRIWRCSGSIST